MNSSKPIPFALQATVTPAATASAAASAPHSAAVALPLPQPQNLLNERLLKMAEVVHLTGMCRSSVYNRLREGAFVAKVKIGPRAIRFPESEVRAWIEAHINARHCGASPSSRA